MSKENPFNALSLQESFAKLQEEYPDIGFSDDGESLEMRKESLPYITLPFSVRHNSGEHEKPLYKLFSISKHGAGTHLATASTRLKLPYYPNKEGVTIGRRDPDLEPELA